MSGSGEEELSREGAFPPTHTMSVTGDVTGEDEPSEEEETSAGRGGAGDGVEGTGLKGNLV